MASKNGTVRKQDLEDAVPCNGPNCRFVGASREQTWAHENSAHRRSRGETDVSQREREPLNGVDAALLGGARQASALQSLLLQQKVLATFMQSFQGNGVDTKLTERLERIEDSLAVLSAAQSAKPANAEGHSAISDALALAKFLQETRPAVDPVEVGTRFMGALKDYSSITAHKSAEDLEALKLGMRMQIWQTERQEEIAARVAENERSRAQLLELVQLGKSAIADAVKPLTTAVGDGLRARVSGAPLPGTTPESPQAQAPPSQKPRNFAEMTDQERDQFRKLLADARAKIEAREAEVRAHDSKGKRHIVEVPPEYTGYGEVSPGPGGE